MDVPTLSSFLRPTLTVTLVWNTGETGDMYYWFTGMRFTNLAIIVFY